MIFLFEYRVISSAPFLSYQNASSITLYFGSGFIREQHLTPITLHPTSMFSSLPSSGRKVSYCERHAQHRPICIQTTLMKTVSHCLTWDSSSCQKKLSYEETFKSCRLQKIFLKKYAILLFIKHQKLKKLSTEIKYSDHKKLLKLNPSGDLEKLDDLVL